MVSLVARRKRHSTVQVWLSAILLVISSATCTAFVHPVLKPAPFQLNVGSVRGKGSDVGSWTMPPIISSRPASLRNTAPLRLGLVPCVAAAVLLRKGSAKVETTEVETSGRSDLAKTVRNHGGRTLKRDKQTPLLRSQGLSGVTEIVSVLVTLGLIIFQGYERLLAAYPLPVDSVTGILLYILSKLSSDVITGFKTTRHDLLKWGVAGLMDGTLTHLWYNWLESVTVSIAAIHAKVSVMCLATAFGYSPIYCALFLIIMVSLDGGGVPAIKAKLKSNFNGLVAANNWVWAAPNILLFGFIPPAFRLVVSMILNYLYIVGLALWECGFFGPQETSDPKPEEVQDRPVLQTVDASLGAEAALMTGVAAEALVNQMEDVVTNIEGGVEEVVAQVEEVTEEVVAQVEEFTEAVVAQVEDFTTDSGADTNSKVPPAFSV